MASTGGPPMLHRLPHIGQYQESNVRGAQDHPAQKELPKGPKQIANNLAASVSLKETQKRMKASLDALALADRDNSPIPEAAPPTPTNYNRWNAVNKPWLPPTSPKAKPLVTSQSSGSTPINRPAPKTPKVRAPTPNKSSGSAPVNPLAQQRPIVPQVQPGEEAATKRPVPAEQVAQQVQRKKAPVSKKRTPLPNGRLTRPDSNESDRSSSSPTKAGPSSGPIPLQPPVATSTHPGWANVYNAGHLGDLGIVPGIYDVNVNKPRNKCERPGKFNGASKKDSKGNTQKIPSIKYAIYTILAKIPGGIATKDVLHKICQEWCPYMDREQSFRASLCRDKEFFMIGGGTWRLSDEHEAANKEAAFTAKAAENAENPQKAPKKRKRVEPQTGDLEEGADPPTQRPNTEGKGPADKGPMLN